MNDKIEFVSGAVLVVIISVLVILSVRYSAYTSWVSLHCDSDSITEQITNCK